MIASDDHILRENFNVSDAITILGPVGLRRFLQTAHPFLGNMNCLRVIEVTKDDADKNHSFGVQSSLILKRTTDQEELDRVNKAKNRYSELNKLVWHLKKEDTAHFEDDNIKIYPLLVKSSGKSTCYSYLLEPKTSRTINMDKVRGIEGMSVKDLIRLQNSAT